MDIFFTPFCFVYIFLYICTILIINNMNYEDILESVQSQTGVTESSYHIAAEQYALTFSIRELENMKSGSKTNDGRLQNRINELAHEVNTVYVS